MDRVCPLLGLAGDHRTAVDGVDSGHRCHAEQPPGAIGRDEQSQLCLTAHHPRCERFRRHLAGSGALQGRVTVGDGLASTRLVIAPPPQWRGIAGRARGASRGRLAAGGMLVVALAAGGATAVAAVLGNGDERTAGHGPSPTQEASPVGPPTATERPSEALVASSDAPTPSPSPSPTEAPTVAPTPVPATPVPTQASTPAPAVQTYVVEAGDTLALIAQQFGTTVSALQAANGIDDPDEIVIGQVLVIP